MEKWINYKNSLIKGSIVAKMSTSHEIAVKENRDYLYKLCEIIKYLAKQGLSLRGHCENVDSLNKGNFLELCILISKFDSLFKSKFENYFNLSSHEIQNDLIKSYSELVIKLIRESIIKTGFYSIQCDEAKSHHKELLTICVRYVDELQIRERFISFQDVSNSRTAKGLYTNLKETLSSIGVFNVPIIAQSYDGASVMSGIYGGVQALLKDDHKNAIFIHCMSHRLNLALVSACCSCTMANDFF